MLENRGRKLRVAIFTLLGAAQIIFATKGRTEVQDQTEGFDKCKIIADDRSRLECFKALLADSPSSSASSAPSAAQPTDTSSAWSLIRTPNPKGGPDALSIMRTADTLKSDPDLAGLIVRCQDKPGLEVLIALVRPLPPRRKRDVILNLGSGQTKFQAEVSATGTGVILPLEPRMLTAQRELSVRLDDPDGQIRGMISLDGLAPALARLSASCLSGRP